MLSTAPAPQHPHQHFMLMHTSTSTSAQSPGQAAKLARHTGCTRINTQQAHQLTNLHPLPAPERTTHTYTSTYTDTHNCNTQTTSPKHAAHAHSGSSVVPHAQQGAAAPACARRRADAAEEDTQGQWRRAKYKCERPLPGCPGNGQVQSSSIRYNPAASGTIQQHQVQSSSIPTHCTPATLLRTRSPGHG